MRDRGRKRERERKTHRERETLRKREREKERERVCERKSETGNDRVIRDRKSESEKYVYICIYTFHKKLKNIPSSAKDIPKIRYCIR